MQLGRTIARIILPVALAGFIATGCGGEDGVLGLGGIPDDAFCTVGGADVKTKEFDTLVSGAKKQYEDNGRDFPKKGSDEYKKLSSEAVSFLVKRELIRSEADRQGVKVTDKDVNKALKDLQEQYFQGDAKKYKEELKRTGYTEARVKADLKDQAISTKLNKKITDDIKISDKDIKKFFEENPDQFVTKESREVAHILVKTKAEADAVYEQVKDGNKATFAKVAKAKTTDPSGKDTGGVLTGGIQRGQTVPPFDKVAFSMKTGEVSKPVKTDFGYHVITARGDVKPETKQKLADVKDDIKKQRQGELEAERLKEWEENLLKDAEDDVSCRKGFVWTQTVTETQDTAPAPAPKADTSEKADTKDADTKDAKDAKDADADKKASNDDTAGEGDKTKTSEDTAKQPSGETEDTKSEDK
jgi:foldase protein PrsA